jgi:hypothetical protein
VPTQPSFSDGTAKRVLTYSHRAQQMANFLPPWNKIRQDREGVGQQLFSVIGRQLEGLSQETDRFMRAGYITLADADEPDLIFSSDIVTARGLPFPTTVKNQLLNSSFEIWSDQSRLPDWWRSTGDGHVEVKGGFLGARALKITPDASGQVEVYQQFDIKVPAGETWAHSLWYTTTGVSFGSPAELRITGTLADGTTTTSAVSFTIGTTAPTRLSLTTSFASAVVRLRFSVFVAAGASDDGTVTFDLCQSEKADFPTGWMPNIFDNWPHVTYEATRLAPLLLEHGIRAQFVDGRDDFWRRALPTRAVFHRTALTGNAQTAAPTADSDGVTVYDSAGRFTQFTFDGQALRGVYQAILDASSNYKVRQIGDSPADIYGTFDLAPISWKHQFVTRTDLTMEAIASIHNHLFVVFRTNDVNGFERRYVGVADQEVPMPFPTYLETPLVLELPQPSPLDRDDWVATTIRSAAFQDGDQQHLILSDGETQWVYRLHYDYFQVSVTDGRLYTREKYTELLPMPSVDVRLQPQADEVDRLGRREAL